MALSLLGLFLFLGMHLFGPLMPDAKARLASTIGNNAYRGLFSAAAIATLCLLIYGFGQARLDTDVLYTPPTFFSHITLSLMLVATIILVSSLLPAGYIATKTKHPMVLAVKIWALAHLLANGETVQVILFAAFLAWGVILRISYKRRERRGELVRRPFRSWTWDVAAIVVGTVVYAAIALKLHEVLIGVAVLPM
jgi:uncharacterized membrane protein